MRDEIEQLGAAIVSQASLPGQATAGYAASTGRVGATGLPRPGYVQDGNGYAVRFFIPGQSPLFVPGMAERFILGDGSSG